MKNEDVVLLHRLWLNITREPGLENMHHHDILTEALTRFAHDYGARDRDDILKELERAVDGRCRGARDRASTRPTRPPERGPRRRTGAADRGRGSTG